MDIHQIKDLCNSHLKCIGKRTKFGDDYFNYFTDTGCPKLLLSKACSFQDFPCVWEDKDCIHSWKVISRLQGIDWCTRCGALKTMENGSGSSLVEVIHLPCLMKGM